MLDVTEALLALTVEELADAAADAALVRAGMRAGLVTVGAVNMTEFAYSGIGLNPHYGTPRNPRDPKVARSPGGSSSGSGAVVAAGIVPAAHASDGGGSIRIPAAFCGVYGHKPTYNLIPLRGHSPPGLDGGPIPLAVVGPLARSAADLALPAPAEGTAEAAARVATAREVQQARMIEARIEAPAGFLNARIEGKALETLAAPDEAGRALLVKAAERGGLSARGWARTLRLARTIADLEGATAVRRIHIAESLIYRRSEPADGVPADVRYLPT